jgi:phosphoribosylamine--glycine ligase
VYEALSKFKVLIVGGGAREHALGILIARSRIEPSIYTISSTLNPGLLKICEGTKGKYFKGKPTDPETVLKVAESFSPDLVVIGPEEPLFSGVADTLRDRGYTVFGPSSKASLIEKDKGFARSIMWKYRIPGRLRYRVFANAEEAAEYARASGDSVVKPVRQAGGRGVRVFGETAEHLSRIAREAAATYTKRLAEVIRSKYNDIENTIIVEERVEGVEYTIMTVTDGSTIVPLPIVEDHPHLYPWDLGPETGGMGSISGPSYTLPFLTEQEFKESVDIVRLSVDAVYKELKEKYVGAISGQMMLTSFWGPTLIEYYSRFGDPEIGNLLFMVESDFLELLDSAAKGKLSSYKLKIKENVYVVNKAVAPEGYPLYREKAKGHLVTVDESKIRELGCELLYGGVDLVDGKLQTTGSRAFEVVCPDERGFEEASRKAEKAISYISTLDGYRLIHRWDIGTKEGLFSIFSFIVITFS